MNTDRELLEKAAKASGFTLANQMIESGWNPITDDGDALRLAVKLGIDVAPFLGSQVTRCWTLGLTQAGINEAHGVDAYAATRLAIVRAAAEIGRAMP